MSSALRPLKLQATYTTGISMVGKMSTTIRVTEMNPIRMISMAAIAIVYGRRRAILTRLIMLKPSLHVPAPDERLAPASPAASAPRGFYSRDSIFDQNYLLSTSLCSHQRDRDTTPIGVRLSRRPYSNLAPDTFTT